MMQLSLNFVRMAAVVCLTAGSLMAVPPGERNPAAETSARESMAAFILPDGFKAELFAAEPMLANPVAITLDAHDRVFVTETYRLRKGVDDNRHRAFWLLEDLANQTVDDRLKMYQKWASEVGGMEYYSRFEERIVRLVDVDGDGRADTSNVFADGFNDPLDGLGAGLLTRGNTMWYTCIPHLWRLKDTNGDGVADERQSLHRGFGVKVSLSGHDLHGLTWGPDGRLYFSIGDRGFHVETPEGRTLHSPGSGAIFRCEPDGSQLEVFSHTLRNPQELAFDQFGNLWTADNNSDAGDKARLVYAVRGAQAGWHMSYQTMTEPYLRGMWHLDRLWHLRHEEQPAWIIPPVAHIGEGPAGFAFNPGNSLGPEYDHHFFMCDFHGGQSNSRIETWRVEPHGAGFEMKDHRIFADHILASDLEFGHDGKIYVSDWVDGWTGIGKGRIHTLQNTRTMGSPAIAENRRLFAEGFEHRDPAQLAILLRHADLRVRREAQFTLAAQDAIPLLAEAAQQTEHRLARLHGVWGLGQIARRNPAALPPLRNLLGDIDAEVRGRVIECLAEAHDTESLGRITQALTATEPRVRFFAAMGLAQFDPRPALDGLLKLIEENNDQDVYLRHAGIMALRAIKDQDAVAAHVTHPSRSVRLAVLLTMRHTRDARIARFLNDPDFKLIVEAARAIYDVPINGAMPALALAITRPENDPSLHRRAINANLYQGCMENAAPLATFIADPDRPEDLRLEAIATLAQWEDPLPRERVLGLYRPRPKRGSTAARAALRDRLADILKHATPNLEIATARLAQQYDLRIEGETLLSWVQDSARSPSTRNAALGLLAGAKDDLLRQAIDAALTDMAPAVRAEARHRLAQLDPDAALPLLEQTAAKGTLHERQRALRSMAIIPDPSAETALLQWLNRWRSGDAPDAIALDILEALRDRKTEGAASALTAYEQSLTAGNDLARFRPSLDGGNPERGRAVFVNHAAAQCTRCHRVDGSGGRAGPELDTLADRADRKHMLESLVNPGAKIAPGYGVMALTLHDGTIVAGTHKDEDAQGVHMELPRGNTVYIEQDRIKTRSPLTSAMPPMGLLLQPTELRDLIAYLATLKAAK